MYELVDFDLESCLQDLGHRFTTTTLTSALVSRAAERPLGSPPVSTWAFSSISRRRRSDLPRLTYVATSESRHALRCASC